MEGNNNNNDEKKTARSWEDLKAHLEETQQVSAKTWTAKLQSNDVAWFARLGVSREEMEVLRSAEQSTKSAKQRLLQHVLQKICLEDVFPELLQLTDAQMEKTTLDSKELKDRGEEEERKKAVLAVALVVVEAGTEEQTVQLMQFCSSIESLKNSQRLCKAMGWDRVPEQIALLQKGWPLVRPVLDEEYKLDDGRLARHDGLELAPATETTRVMRGRIWENGARRGFCVIKKVTSGDGRIEKEAERMQRVQDGGWLFAKMLSSKRLKDVIVMEYGRCGSLEDGLVKLQGERLQEETAKKILKEVADGLTWLHKKGWAHRDMKSKNVVLFCACVDDACEGWGAKRQHAMQAKLIDFEGLANSEECKKEKFKGTQYYLWPELEKKDGWGSLEEWQASDWYAFGVIGMDIVEGMRGKFVKRSSVPNDFEGQTGDGPFVQNLLVLLKNLVTRPLEQMTLGVSDDLDRKLVISPSAGSGQRSLEQRLQNVKEELCKLYVRNIDLHRMLEERLFLKDVFLEPRVVHWDPKSDLSSTGRLKLPQVNVLAKKGHVALWGKAGAGKSSLCQWMAWEWSQGRLKDVEWLVYLDLPGSIELLQKRSHAEGADQRGDWSLFDLLNAYWRGKKVISMDKDEKEAERIVEAMEDKWILVLDGLDEAKAKSDARVAKLLGNIRDDRWNDVRRAKMVLLAGRPPERKEEAVVGRWTELEIVGLGEEERRKYVEKMFSDRPELAHQVMKEMETEPLNDLACVPLQLQMICFARGLGSEEQFNGLADLYSKTLSLFLRREVYLKEREVATVEDKEKIVCLKRILEDMAGEEGVLFEEKDVQLLSRSGIVYRLDEMSKEDKKKALLADIEDSVDEAPKWKWYHTSFKDFYQARRAVRLVEELGKDASDWDRAVCFNKSLGKANVLCCRLAMWTAKEAGKKNCTDLFRGCFWGWLMVMTEEVVNDGFWLSKELEGWKEAALFLSNVNSDGLDEKLFSGALFMSGRCFDRMGCWNDALKRYDECHEVHKRVFGLHHANYLKTLHIIALVYHNKGQYDEALKRFKECRELQKRVLGPEHPSYLTTLNDIAIVYNSKGQYDEALKLFEECREVMKRVLGPEHPDYLATLGNIALVYNLKGQYDEALKLYEECQEVRKRVLGPEHPDYLTMLNNIALVYISKRKYDDALKRCEECCELGKRVLGPEHPNYLSMLNNFAFVNFSVNKYDEALKRYQECLEVRKRVLGPEHPNYLVTLNNIALVYRSKGQYDEALKLFEECREVMKRVLGPEHPSYVTALSNIALVYNSKGLYDEALKLHEECREVRKRVLGPEHPSYLTTLSNIALVFKSKGLYNESLKLHEECLQLQKMVLGPEHPDYLVTLSQLADVHNLKGESDESLNLFQECSPSQLRLLGAEHPNYLKTLGRIAFVFQQKGQYDEALKRYEECLEVQKRVLGPEHPDYLMTLHAVAVVHIALNNLEAAYPFLRVCVASARKIRFFCADEWERELNGIEQQMNFVAVKSKERK